MNTSIVRAHSLPGMLPSNDERSSSTPSATTCKVCVTCGATKTPMWRTNTDGQKTLCNACGVRLHREQKKSRACSTAQLKEAVPSSAPGMHPATEADPHVLLRSRATTCHTNPAAPGAEQQRHIVFRSDVAAGYDGGLMRKRSSQEGCVSPRTKASRTRSMPEPSRNLPADTTISWIMQQLKNEVLRTQCLRSSQQPSTGQAYRAALPPMTSPYASQEAQMYLEPAWSGYQRALPQQPAAWRPECGVRELGLCTAGDALLAAASSQPPAAPLPPYRRPAPLFPPALPQDSPADLDPLDPRFLAHISDPGEHLDVLPSSPIEQTSFESEDTFLRLGGDAEAEAEFPLRMSRGSVEGRSPAGLAAHRVAFPSSQAPGSPPRRGGLPLHHRLSAVQDYHTIMNYEKQLADFATW